MTLPCISAPRTGDEFLPGSPSFVPNERFDAIEAAREALDEAEQALKRGLVATCDRYMADAASCLVP